MRHSLASLLRVLADTLDPAPSVTIRITGDPRAARAAIADAELAIRRASNGHCSTRNVLHEDRPMTEPRRHLSVPAGLLPPPPAREARYELPVERHRQMRALLYEYVTVKGFDPRVIRRVHARLTAKRKDGRPVAPEDLRRALERHVSRRISDARRVA